MYIYTCICMYIYIYIFVCGPQDGKLKFRNSLLAETAKWKRETESSKRNAETVKRRNGETENDRNGRAHHWGRTNPHKPKPKHL